MVGFSIETGEGIPAVRIGGRKLPSLVPDLDATLVACHSEREGAVILGAEGVQDQHAAGILLITLPLGPGHR